VESIGTRLSSCNGMNLDTRGQARRTAAAVQFWRLNGRDNIPRRNLITDLS